MGGCKPLRRSAADERGQSMVEFTLLLPALLLMVVGVINFAFVFHTYVQLVNAAGVGATYAASGPSAVNDLAGIAAAALADRDNWHCAKVDAGRSALVGDPYGYQRVSVTVTCVMSDLILWPTGWGPVEISATATRRVRK
ncbi:MAG: TadE/TadG family type IV pilus assembly protein [Anaerolineae bacterium]